MSAPPDGSALCLACGLCCRGVLHDHVVLARGEEDAARALRLPVLTERAADEPPAFALPCPRLKDDRCTVYERRPHTCRAYRCALLERFLGGAVGRDEALEHVRRARRLETTVLDALELSADDPGTLWQRLDRLKRRGRQLPADVLLDAAELDILCQREFLNEREKRS